VTYQKVNKPAAADPGTQRRVSPFAPRSFAVPRTPSTRLRTPPLPQSAALAQRVTISNALDDNVVNNALTAAREMMDSAINGLGEGGDKGLQKLWFGSLTNSDRHALTVAYQKMRGADDMSFTTAAELPAHVPKPRGVGYPAAWRVGSNDILLNPATLDDEGLPQTLVHEISHYVVDTQDYSNPDWESALALAKRDKDKAQANATSLELYAADAHSGLTRKVIQGSALWHALVLYPGDYGVTPKALRQLKKVAAIAGRYSAGKVKSDQEDRVIAKADEAIEGLDDWQPTGVTLKEYKDSLPWASPDVEWDED
jgi:hypothetical protein